MSQNQVVANFHTGFSRVADNIRKALPAHVPFDRFERVVKTAVQVNPDLLGADQKSLFLACQRAAADGLLPDGREGALVLYGRRVQWMPMIAGILKLVRNSDQLAAINAHIIYEGETYSIRLGMGEAVEHERNFAAVDGGKAIAVYGVARLKNGESVLEVMTWGQVMKIRSRSRAKDSGPWVTDTEEMARKTVLRRLSKKLPLSSDKDGDVRLRSAIEADDAAITLDGGAALDIEDAPRPDKLAMLEDAAPLDAGDDGALAGDSAAEDPEARDAAAMIATIEGMTLAAKIEAYMRGDVIKSAIGSMRPDLAASVRDTAAARIGYLRAGA